MPKRLVMMWDYTTDGLWEADTGYHMPAEQLPLTDRTRDALREWVARIDAINLGLMDTEDADLEDPELVELDAVGRALWREVRRELGSDYEVGYAVSAGEEIRTIWAPTGESTRLPWMGGR